MRHITREELQQASERGHKFADVIRRSGTGLRVSEGNFVTTHCDHPSRMLCIQARGRGQSSFQSSRPASGPPVRGGELYPLCDMVPIFLDGIQLADPGAQLRDLELDNVDRIEWLSSIAATTRFGLNARNQAHCSSTREAVGGSDRGRRLPFRNGWPPRLGSLPGVVAPRAMSASPLGLRRCPTRGPRMGLAAASRRCRMI